MPTSRMPATHTSARAVPASHRKASAIQFSQLGEVRGALGSGCEFRTSLRVFLSTPRLGSALSFATAAAISSRVGCGASAAVVVMAVVRKVMQANISATPVAAARRRADSSPERTTELLFDVPRLEFGATIQVESEAGGHVKRLDEPDRQGVADTDNEIEPTRSGPPEDLHRQTLFGPLGCEPSDQRHQCKQQ